MLLQYQEDVGLQKQLKQLKRFRARTHNKWKILAKEDWHRFLGIWRKLCTHSKGKKDSSHLVYKSWKRKKKLFSSFLQGFLKFLLGALSGHTFKINISPSTTEFSDAKIVLIWMLMVRGMKERKVFRSHLASLFRLTKISSTWNLCFLFQKSPYQRPY